MPIPLSSLGTKVSARSVADTRWLMSYAAAVGDGDNPFYTLASAPAIRRVTNDFHTSGVQGTGVIAHPVFVWALEWPMLWLKADELFRPAPNSMEAGLKAGERGTGLHYSEDIVIHRPISANDEITTECSVCSIEKRARGSFVRYRFVHRVAASGELLCTSWNGTYWPGVKLSSVDSMPQNTEGGKWSMEGGEPPPMSAVRKMDLPSTSHVSTNKMKHQGNTSAPMASIAIPIDSHLGIVYSECARIWNPIHSDIATARASGLKRPILHGTATLAKSVSAIVKRFTVHNNPATVHRVSVEKFSAPVFMPSTLTLNIVEALFEREASSGACNTGLPENRTSIVVNFELKTEDGSYAIRGGCVVLRSMAAHPATKLRARSADYVVAIREIDLERDLDSIVDLFASGMRLYSEKMPDGSPLQVHWNAYIENAINSDLSDIEGVYLKPGGNFWVAIGASGKIVGQVAAEFVDADTGVMELRRMSVAPSMRQQGLGSKLVKHVERYAATKGCKELILTTGSVMKPARSLYVRNGFEQYHVEPKTTNAMRSAGQEFSIVHFRKPITSPSGRWTWVPSSM